MRTNREGYQPHHIITKTGGRSNPTEFLAFRNIDNPTNEDAADSPVESVPSGPTNSQLHEAIVWLKARKVSGQLTPKEFRKLRDPILEEIRSRAKANKHHGKKTDQ